MPRSETQLELTTLGAIATKITSGATPESGNERYYTEEGVPFVKIEDLTATQGAYLDQTILHVTKAALRESAIKIYPAGTILVSMYGTVGLTKIIRRSMAANQALAALIPPFKCNSHYLYHYLNWSQTEWDKYKAQTTQANINGEIVRRRNIYLPSADEQQRIADILDTLDTLIGSQQRVVEKLKVLAAATIENELSRVIESVDAVLPLKTLANIVSGVTLGTETAGSIELPYLRVANVQDGYIDTSDMKKVRVSSADAKRYLLEAGDVLLTEGGDLDKLGRGAVWDARIDPCICQNHIFRVRCDRLRLIPQYLAVYTSSFFGKSYFLSIAKQTTNLASINSTQLKNMPIPLPGIEKQRQLAAMAEAGKDRLASEIALSRRLGLLKQGLTEDLMTGRVQVSKAESILEGL